MVRTPCCDNSGLRKGTWTPEEDKKLIAYVTRYGCWNWRLLPKFAERSEVIELAFCEGLARCGKSCRLRWLNYLRPDIKRGDYTQEEEDTIIRLHEKLGNRWSMIAANLPGRTDNEIKNHWHSVLKKRFLHNSSAKAASKSKKNHHDDHSPTFMESNNNKQMEGDLSENSSNIGPIMSPQPSSSVTTETTTSTEAATIINHHHHHEENNFVVQDVFDLANILDAYNEPLLGSDFWTEPYLTDVSYVPPPTTEYDGAATVPLMHQPNDEYFSPIWDVESWSQNNTSFYQECGGLFY